MKHIIFHIDVNSAFLSWTALSLLEQGDTTDLREIASIIGGDKEKRHGIILTANQNAAKFGVKTAEPIWQAKQKNAEVKVEEYVLPVREVHIPIPQREPMQKRKAVFVFLEEGNDEQ